MNLLIAGCGYLGQRVAARWRGTVYGLTRSSEKAQRLMSLGTSPIVGDLCDASSLPSLPPVDALLYAVGFDGTSPHDRHVVQVEGLKHVLHALRHNVPTCVLASSTSVYAQSDGSIVDETSPTAPQQPGGIAALAAEQQLAQFQAEAGGENRACLLRFAGLYGPGRLLAKVDQLRAGAPLAGRGDSWLNLIHIDDATTAAVTALESAAWTGPVLCCDDRPVLRSDYYQTLARLAGTPPPVFAPEQSAKRGAGGLNKRCNNARFRSLLGNPLQFPDMTTGLVNAWNGSPQTTDSKAC